MFMEVLSEEIILNWDLNDKKAASWIKKKKKNREKCSKKMKQLRERPERGTSLMYPENRE